MGEAVSRLEMPPSPLLTDSKNIEIQPRQTEGHGREQEEGVLFIPVYTVNV